MSHQGRGFPLQRPLYSMPSATPWLDAFVWFVLTNILNRSRLEPYATNGREEAFMDISCLCCMLRWPGSRALRLATLCGLLASGSAGATPYVWPIGNSSTPDAMNTSFGSRVNFSKWDFHDGIDLPGACGTEVHAVATGTVVSFGDANPPTWSSRHVVIKVDDSAQGMVYVYYFHLQKYASNLV